MTAASSPPQDPPGSTAESVRLRLYVAGESPNSAAAVANLRSVVDVCVDHRIFLEIIDLLREPERGIEDGVFVTPMLIRLAPLPERRILGSLHDRAALLGILEVGGVEQ